MNITELIYSMSDTALAIPFYFIIFASLVLTIISRGIQFRTLSTVGKLLWHAITLKKQPETANTISPLDALATAMSSIGTGTIVGPIIAIGWGGPGALAGYIIGTILGAAVTFTEVRLAMMYRKRRADGSISGGPMEYLHDEFSPFLAKIYAFFGFLLLTAWSSVQSNAVAVQLNTYGCSTFWFGIILTGLIMLLLIRGIKIIGRFNEKLVPLKFITYISAMAWILIVNHAALPEAFASIWHSLFTPATALGASIGFGLNQTAMRWGISRSIHSNEAGIGTSTFPHSVAQADSYSQSILAMVSVYSNGILCFLTGLAILVSGASQDTTTSLDITVFARIMENHFAAAGPILLLIFTFMFAFGTILSNCYNGSQCFLYLTKQTHLKNGGISYYYLLAAITIFLGSIADFKFVWTIIDFFLLPVAIPHVIAIVILALRRKDLFSQPAPTYQSEHSDIIKAERNT